MIPGLIMFLMSFGYDNWIMVEHVLQIKANCLNMPVMTAKSLIADLHLKFAEKTWSDTFQLVRRCMDKSRDDSKPRETLVRCMERLHEALHVSSVNGMRSRLELIAKQNGMGFHFTEATCYLTADLFYLEVVLLQGGGVEDVKVAPHGEVPMSSESLLQLLRLKDFVAFSVKLADLSAFYNFPGENETKIKLFTCLQNLGQDLQKISHLSSALKECDCQEDMILNGRIGRLIARKEGFPLTVQFYISPTEVLETSDSKISDVEPVVQTAQVIVGLSDATHQLQMASLMPQLDPQGHPVFTPLSEVLHETLPACFLLRLQPALPTLSSFVNKLSQVTDVTIPDADLQWAAFPKLLMRSSLNTKSPGETFDEQDTIFMVPLPGEMMHSYVFPGAAWEAPALKGTVVKSIPFTHPAHVPALLELLRHQCTINTLLSSCATSQWASPVPSLHFEVLPESDTSFSVTFLRPDIDSLAVLLVDVPGSHQVTCSLFGIDDPSMDEYISSVMKRSLSLPVTMRALYGKLREISSPLPPVCPATTEAGDDRPAPSPVLVSSNSESATVAESSCGPAAPSTPVSQSVPGPEDSSTVPAPACFVMSVATSELLPEIKTSPPVKPYPFTTVGVFSH
ncbi:mediator of RNA polymerase II transcription subunit 1-like isoform X3 [Myripristis murdjan]|uniref:mediator of RNA polymerase II transcription subunit 1-like isoform X3 n=1 Tax=Myripristis murdjan TaxID=586833 RepID=UPI0011762B76|nr:mediator of RNA polymerase II transcription subunit 1-like isoform X3 [Myripristis murdjan]